MRVVKSTETFYTACDWSPGAEKLAHTVEHFAYEPEDHELPPPAEILRRCAPVAAECIRASVEKGGNARVVMEACTEKIAEFIARSIAHRVPALKTEVGGPGLHDEDGADLSHLDREPIEESAHEQPGADDLPHLDSERMKELAARNNPPATVDCGPSKSIAKVLVAAGFTEAGTDADGIEHFVHKDAQHEALLHESGEFAVKSGWTGGVSAGDSVEDLEQVLDEIE